MVDWDYHLVSPPHPPGNLGFIPDSLPPPSSTKQLQHVNKKSCSLAVQLQSHGMPCQ